MIDFHDQLTDVCRQMVRTIPSVTNALVLCQVVSNDAQSVTQVFVRFMNMMDTKPTHVVNIMDKGVEKRRTRQGCPTQGTIVLALLPLVDTMDMKGVAAREPSYIHRMFLVVQANGTRFHGLETLFECD